MTTPGKIATIRFKSSNFFPDKTGELSIGDYVIEQAPSVGNSEATLTFTAQQNELPRSTFFSRLRLESNYFLSFLSLASSSNCEFEAGLYDYENIVVDERKYILARKPFDFAAVKEYYERLCCLKDEDKRRFVNASRRYRQAVSIYEKEPVVSFFLLVVSVECLSNKIILKESDVDWEPYESFYGPSFKRNIRNGVKFVEFICRYLSPEILAAEGEMSLLKRRLISAYLIRNRFVHDGEDMPVLVSLADSLGRKSIVYLEQGSDKEYERRVPAMLWLEKIVVNSLLGYLMRESSENPASPGFKEYAEKTGLLKVKLRQPHPSIAKYQGIEVDFARKYFEGDD